MSQPILPHPPGLTRRHQTRSVGAGWLQGFAALALLWIPSLAAAELDPVERRLVAHAEAHANEALPLLERAVNLNSGTHHHSGVREVGGLFAEEFEALGFSTRWEDGSAFDRAGHLVAEWNRGAGNAPYLLLIGHLDTVFEPESPFQRFERSSESEARGPGVIDMKGGNVVMLHALASLAAAGVLDDLRITAILTGDEEANGEPVALARRSLLEAARGAHAAIGFEDGDGDPATAVIARRGSASWTLEVSGVAAHSSQVFTEEVGFGAIYEAARILTAFREELAGEQDLTFNPGVILGGTDVALHSSEPRGSAFGKSNVVAEHATVLGDLRALSPKQYERAKAAMRAVVERNLPRTTAQITFRESIPPLAATDGNRELLALYDQVSRDLGFGPVTAVDPRNAGAADVSWVGTIVPRVIDGIGLMGRGGHTVEETADLRTLPIQIQRAAVLIYRLAQQLREP